MSAWRRGAGSSRIIGGAGLLVYCSSAGTFSRWRTRRDVGDKNYKLRCQPFRADDGPRRTGQVLARAGLSLALLPAQALHRPSHQRHAVPVPKARRRAKGAPQAQAHDRQHRSDAERVEKIEERNSELLKLKLTTGNIVQTLNASKKRLNRLMVESETLKRMIMEKQALTKKVQEEIDGIEVEKVKVKKANTALQKQIEESGMPEVLEYVQQKATAHQLKKDLNNYERKLEIAEMELRRTRNRTIANTMAGVGMGSTLRR